MTLSYWQTVRTDAAVIPVLLLISHSHMSHQRCTGSRPAISCPVLLAWVVARAGIIVYHGPRHEVIPFFSSLGFEMPERKGAADFLQEITSRKDQKVQRTLI